MSQIIQLTSETFPKEVLQSDLPVLVDFWAPWCTPCLMAAPILEELAKDYQGKIKIAKLNVEEPAHQTLAAQYNIQSIPNMKIFYKGEIIEEIIGLRPKEDFVRVFENVLRRLQHN